MSPGKARPATGASEREETLADLLAHGRLLASVAPVGVPWPPPSTGPEAAQPAAAVAPAEPAPASLDHEAGLRAIREEMGDCRRCRLAGGPKDDRVRPGQSPAPS